MVDDSQETDIFFSVSSGPAVRPTLPITRLKRLGVSGEKRHELEANRSFPS